MYSKLINLHETTCDDYKFMITLRGNFLKNLKLICRELEFYVYFLPVYTELANFLNASYFWETWIMVRYIDSLCYIKI